MCGNFFKPSSNSFLGGPIGRTLLTAAAIPVLGPGAGALTGLGAEAGGALAGAATGGLLGASAGGGLSGALKGAALGGAGGYLGSGGLSDITNGLGLTTNGISDLTPSWLGGPGGYSSGGGLSNFAGADPGTTLDPTQAISGSATTAAPASSGLQGYLPSSGIPSAGGGSPGGFFNYDLGGNAAGTAGGIADGIGGTSGQPGFLSTLLSPADNTGSFNYDIGGNAAGVSSYSPSAQLANGLSTGGSSGMNYSSLLPSNLGSSLVNGGLKSGLGYFLNQTPSTKGLQAAYGQSAANYQPFLQSGQAANAALGNLYGLNGTQAQQAATQNWQNTPGYQFALNQGIQGLEAANAARGMNLSGNESQAIQQYGTGLANQYYNQYLQNLQQQAGQGLNAAGGVGGGISNAAGAQYQGLSNTANNQNQALGGLLNAFFPTQVGYGGAGTGNSGGGLLNYLYPTRF